MATGYSKDRWLLETFAGLEIERLERLVEAVEQWDNFIQEKFTAKLQEAEEPTGELTEWMHDHFGDEAFLLLDTKRIMCAGIAVAIASITEGFAASLCHTKDPSRSLIDKRGRRISWGQLRQLLETDIGTNLSGVPGFAGTNRARVLGNCFKHCLGRADREVQAETKIAEGSGVEFEKEDWRRLVSDTKEFLLALAVYL